MKKILGISIAALTLAAPTVAQSLQNGDFETPETIMGVGTHPLQPGCGYLPCTFGDWIGDQGLIATNGTLGIDTRSGNGMLQFVSTSLERAAGGSSDVWQSIDLSSQSDAIDQGGMVSRVCGYVNRVAGDASSDSAFILGVFASDGDVGDWIQIASDQAWLSKTNLVFLSDNDPATWEKVSASVVLPEGTRFVSVQISAWENVVNNGTLPEFDGHFADDISFDLFDAAPVIRSSFGRGKLRFRVPDTNAIYSVEWAHSPNGPYFSTWAPLREIQPEGELVELAVPTFYRVRGGNIPPCPDE